MDLKKWIFPWLALLMLTACSEKNDASPREKRIPAKTASVSVSETVSYEPAKPAEELHFSDSFDLTDFAEEGCSLLWVYPCGNNLCAAYSDGSGRCTAIIIDPVKKISLNSIAFPAKSCRLSFAESRGNEKICGYAEFISEDEDRTALAEIYPDGNFVLTAGHTKEDILYPCGGNLIKEREGGLFPEGGSSALIEDSNSGKDDTDLNLKSYYFSYPLDNDRFVYRAAGYEALLSFGIYDFTEGKTAEFRDSANKLPIGIKDGLVYSKEAYSDGFGSRLYVSDPTTLETRLLCYEPFETADNEYTEFYFSSEESCIAAHKHGISSPDRLAVIGLNGVISAYADTSEDKHFDSAFVTDGLVFLRNGSVIKTARLPEE